LGFYDKETQMQDEKKWLTRKEAVEAGYFTSEKNAANMASQRIGPPFYRPRGGGKVRYRREDLEKWLERGVVLTTDSDQVRERKKEEKAIGIRVAKGARRLRKE
jgi:hypothetical protein